MQAESSHNEDLSPHAWAALKSRFLDIADGELRPTDDDSGILRELLHADQSAGRFLGALDDTNDLAAPNWDELTASLSPGEVFADCRIVRLAGRGGMSEVYEAEDLGLGVGRDNQPAASRRIALKLLPGSMADHRRHAALRRDADALSRLAHPGVARVYRGGVAPLPGGQPRPYLALEFIEGPTIDRFVREQLQRGARRDRLALELGLQLADAVACSHRSGVVHRDLKAGNILVRPDGSPAILDFGIARLLDDAHPGAPSSTVTMQLEGVGSLSSISPERARGEDSGKREDVWALGVLLFDIAAGRPPHDLTDLPAFEAAQLIGRVPPPRLVQVAPRTPRDLATVIDRCLAFDPGDRYADAGEVLAELQRVRDGVAPRARAIGPIGRLWRWARRHRAIAASLAATLVILTVSSISLAILATNAASARRLAEERRASSEAVANGLLFEVSEALIGVPGASEARARLLEIGLEYAEAALAREGELDSASRLALARALVSLGSARFVRGVAGEGARRAGEAFERGRDLAIGVADEREAGSPEQAEALGLAAMAARLAAFAADSMGAEHLDVSVLQLPKSLAERALAIDPTQREALLALAYVHIWLGDDARQRGDWRSGVDLARQAVDCLTPLCDASPDDGEAHSMLALSWSALAQRLCWARMDGQPVGAIEEARRAVEVAEAAALLDPYPQAQARRWGCRIILARAIRLERPDQTEDAARALLEAVAGVEAVAARDPEDTQVARDMTALCGLAGEEFEALAPLAPTPEARTAYLAQALRLTERSLALMIDRAERGLALAHERALRERALAALERLRAQLGAALPANP